MTCTAEPAKGDINESDDESSDDEADKPKAHLSIDLPQLDVEDPAQVPHCLPACIAQLSKASEIQDPFLRGDIPRLVLRNAAGAADMHALP